MSSKYKKIAINLLGLALSALFIYLCIDSLKNESLKEVFLLPRPWLLSLVVLLNLVIMGLHALLWFYLLRPMQKIPLTTLFDVLNIGYMANNLLPFKAGEFFRASFISKKYKIPYTQALTTVGLERYFSGFTLILLIPLIATFLPVPNWIQSGAYITGAILIIVQIFLMVLWKRKPDLSKWEKRHPIFYHSFKTLAHIGEGSNALRSYPTFFYLMFLALVTWLAQGLMLYLIQIAFAISLSFMGSLFVLVAINLAIALPSAPANLGTFEFAAILAFTFLGVDKAAALGMGFYFHFLQVIPVTLIGLFYYFRWGLHLKDIEANEPA